MDFNITVRGGVTLECIQRAGDDGITCTHLVAEADTFLISMIIAILVIAAISLVVAMGGALSLSYLARVIREDKEKEECHCSHRKSIFTQAEMGGTSHQMALPGLTNQTSQKEFAEMRARSATAPDIRTAKGNRNDYENTKLRDKEVSPLKPRRSRSLTNNRLGKLGLRFNRKSGVAANDQPTEKKKKKDKILKGHSTSNDLLQNMRVINYELTGKGDFKPPLTQKKSNEYEESDERPLVGITDETSSPEGEQPPKSGANGNPVYYTLETTNTGDELSSDDGACAANSFDEDDDDAEKVQNQPKHSPTLMPNHLEQLPIFSRSMSDAFEKKRKKPSFKIVSTSTSKRESKKVISATWNSQELAKNKKLLQRGGSARQRHISRSSEVYEDIENGAMELQPHGGSGGVEFHPYNGRSFDVQPAERPGSYSCLSRSLEDGLAGYKEQVDLPGYQKLAVGSEFDDGYEMSAGVAV